MIRHRVPGRRARRAALALLAAAALAACSSSGPSPASTTASLWSVGTPTADASGSSPSGAGSSGAGSPSSGAGVEGGTAGAQAPPTGSPAQPPADATRDGVPPAVALLPPAERVRVVPPGGSGRTRVTAPGDGVWVISRPAGADAGYAEVLHLDGAGAVVKAYPFPRLAPQWLLVTPRAVYCGRHGDAAAPDAMVCRIDRASGTLRVLVTADRADHTVLGEEDVAGRPGTWVLDDRTFTVDLGTPPRVGTELTFSSSSGTLRLDPDTLGVLGS